MLGEKRKLLESQESELLIHKRPLAMGPEVCLVDTEEPTLVWSSDSAKYTRNADVRAMFCPGDYEALACRRTSIILGARRRSFPALDPAFHPNGYKLNVRRSEGRSRWFRPLPLTSQTDPTTTVLVGLVGGLWDLIFSPYPISCSFTRRVWRGYTQEDDSYGR